jgi:hypothetical protein
MLRHESGLATGAKRLRMDLLQTKAELERELGRLALHCRRRDRRVQWVSGGPTRLRPDEDTNPRPPRR